MGEARRRRHKDPTYGILPKDGVVAPLWTVHNGVLFLVGDGDMIASLPACNMVIPNAVQARELDKILAENPDLLEGEAISQEGIYDEPLTTTLVDYVPTAIVLGDDSIESVTSPQE